jgi:hypothetical protein
MNDDGNSSVFLQWGEPVLTAPSRRVGRIDRHNPNTLIGTHLNQPNAKPASRHPCNHTSPLLASPTSPMPLTAASSEIVKVEILNRYCLAAARLS